MLDPGTGFTGQADSVIAGTGIEHDHFPTNLQQGFHAPDDAICFIFCDDDTTERKF